MSTVAAQRKLYLAEKKNALKTSSLEALCARAKQLGVETTMETKKTIYNTVDKDHLRKLIDDPCFLFIEIENIGHYYEPNYNIVEVRLETLPLKDIVNLVAKEETRRAFAEQDKLEAKRKLADKKAKQQAATVEFIKTAISSLSVEQLSAALEEKKKQQTTGTSREVSQ